VIEQSNCIECETPVTPGPGFQLCEPCREAINNPPPVEPSFHVLLNNLENVAIRMDKSDSQTVSRKYGEARALVERMYSHNKTENEKLWALYIKVDTIFQGGDVVAGIKTLREGIKRK